jgi:hypothetical protein
MAKATANLYQDGATVEYGSLHSVIHAVMADVASINDAQVMTGAAKTSRSICGKRVRVYAREYMEQAARRYSWYRPCETCTEIAPSAATALFP